MTVAIAAPLMPKLNPFINAKGYSTTGMLSVAIGAVANLVLDPLFIFGFNFGAGGSSNNNKTIEIAKKIKNQYNVEPVVHLTCLCYNKAEIDEFTRQLSYEGIENILALRGDRNPNVPAKEDFLHASDLIKYIKDTTGDQFCIAGACYPDIHPEAADKVDDIKNLKKKVDAGAELLLSQLFFDNDTFFNFAEDCRLAGINVPVIPGIMPCCLRICAQSSGTSQGT